MVKLMYGTPLQIWSTEMIEEDQYDGQWIIIEYGIDPDVDMKWQWPYIKYSTVYGALQAPIFNFKGSTYKNAISEWCSAIIGSPGGARYRAPYDVNKNDRRNSGDTLRQKETKRRETES